MHYLEYNERYLENPAILYRIETVLGCDRILVMEEGVARELDTPTRLLDNKQSLFYKLYKEHTS